MQRKNHQFRLIARPIGMPKPSDWSYTQSPVPELAAKQLLVEIAYISLDPAMRGWMNEGKSYIAPVGLGEVMRAGAVGRVIESKNPAYVVGDHVVGMFGVQEFAVSDGKGITKVDPSKAPLPVYLSALGMTGMTAYFGLLEVAKLKSGETVVVSGAAGAVGSLVGQIAKLKGCRVIGIAGGSDKCRYLIAELGFDAAIDYKSENVQAALLKHCPQGLDVYFDNVGGDILNAALSQLALHARIVICGAISQYNNKTAVQGPSNYLALLVQRARMEGMVIFDYASRYAEAAGAMAEWIAAGKIRSREHIVPGLETFPDTLQMLFKGENLGKLVLKV